LERAQTCPIDRQPLMTEDLGPSRIMRKMVDKLVVSCECKGHGCPATKTIETIEAHERRCEFRMLVCKHEDNGCPERMLRQDYDDHAADCSYAKVKCSRCNHQMLLKDRDEHLAELQCFQVLLNDLAELRWDCDHNLAEQKRVHDELMTEQKQEHEVMKAAHKVLKHEHDALHHEHDKWQKFAVSLQDWITVRVSEQKEEHEVLKAAHEVLKSEHDALQHEHDKWQEATEAPQALIPQETQRQPSTGGRTGPLAEPKQVQDTFGAGVTRHDMHGLHPGWARNPTGDGDAAFINLATLQSRPDAVLQRSLPHMHDHIPDLGEIKRIRAHLQSRTCRTVLDHLSETMDASEAKRGTEYNYDELIECIIPVFISVASAANQIFESVLHSNPNNVTLSFARSPHEPDDHAAWAKELGPNWRQDFRLNDDHWLRTKFSKILADMDLRMYSKVPKSLLRPLKVLLGHSDVVDMAVNLYTVKVLARLQRPQQNLPLLTVGRRVGYAPDIHTSIEFRPGNGKCKTCLILVPAVVDNDGGKQLKAIAHGL